VKGLPTVPLADVGLVMTGAGTVIVSVSVALAVPERVIALRATEEVPAAVGVPEIAPVLPFRLSPDGNPVAP
jgi:hypothetical protein